jgi:hypothetical protein
MNSSLRVMLGYSQEFLNAMESDGGLEQYEIYLEGLLEESAGLTDPQSAQRFQTALAPLQDCYSLYQRNPQLKEKIIVPAIKRFVRFVTDETNNAFDCHTQTQRAKK